MLSRVAVMVNAGNPQAVLEMRQVQATAPTLGLEVVTLEIRRSDLWTKSTRPVAPRRRPYRQDSARGEARRHPGRAADQIGSGREPNHGEGVAPHCAAGAARPPRRGHRVAAGR
jgi:hypothetical protein